MAEKDKCSEPLRDSSSQSHPAKDQIIARLVQIREYTEKAEEALHAVPPNSQNDPKFYQLQEMLAEMRETEKRLTDILRDYEMESPFRNAQGLTSNYASNISDDAGEDFSLLGAHSVNGIEPGLLAERDKLRKRCQDSQLRIEALEKQKNYLLEVCGRADSENYSSKTATGCNDQDLDIDNRLQIVREADSSMFSRRSQSTHGLLSSEGLFLPEENERKHPEASDKRLEIHNIISEIALLRRAKDESARKIDLLQQALNSNTANGDSLNFETPMTMGEKSDQLQELMNDATITSDRDQSSDNGSFSGAPWMTDSFSQTITRKLTEIQTMREKLDALQSLVHTIPVPASYPVETQGDINAIRGLYGSDSSSRVRRSFVELREQVQDICNHMNRESFRGRFELNSSGTQNKFRLKAQSDIPVTVPHRKETQIQRQRSSLAAGTSDDAANLEDRNLDFPRQVKSGSNSIQNNYYSEMDMRRSRNRSNKKSRSRGSSDYTDDRDRCTQRQGIDCISSQRQESPSSSFVVYNPRELKPAPAPLWEHNSDITGEPLLFSVPGRYGHENRNIISRNDRDGEFATRNPGGSIDIDGLSVTAFTSERSRELMSAEDRIVGNPVSDSRNWGPFPNSPGVSSLRGYSNNPQVLNSGGNYMNFGVEKYITESNGMLKHIVHSIGLIATGLTSQKKQLETLKDSVDRLTQRVDIWMGDGANSSRGIHDEQMDMRRNNVSHGAFSMDAKTIPGILPHIGGLETRGNSGCEREHGTFYQGARGQHNAEMHFGCASPRVVKGINPMREMWSAASNAPLNVNYPSEQPNLHPFGDEPTEMPRSSAFYGHNQPIAPKVKRPWVSPSSSMEPNRLMLNNQVPPGNRANNYWDNFRSQSRQNVLSSTSKSNESFNTVLAINSEAAHNQAAGVSASSNFNRLDSRHDKNPGAKPIKAVMMKHFVENIGSKKRNQEQQRQLFPQRSVSVGSMHHLGGENSGASTSESSQANIRHGTNDVNGGAQCFGMNKLYLNNPRDLCINKLVPKDANLLPQALPSRDCLREMCSKVSQLKNDHIRQRTIDALRNYVAQSVWQDSMEVHAEPDSSFSRANMELQGGEPLPGTSHTQTSTPSSRSGDLNEVMWLDPDPFMSNDARLLPYAGNVGVNPIPSQSGTTSRRDGGLFDDSHSYLSNGSRLPAYTRTDRDRGETISSSSTGTSRPGTLNDLWMDSLRMPFVADDSRLPPFIQSDRADTLASDSSSRQGTFNDLCMDSSDPFLASVSILPSTCMRTGSESPSTSLINRFHEPPKCTSEASKPPTASSSNTRVGTDRSSSSVVYINEKQQLPNDTELGCGASVPSVRPICEDDKSYNTTIVTSELDVGVRNGNDLDGVGSGVTPMRDLSTVEADLDASLMNISGSKFLGGEAGTPESSSPALNSGFDSSIKYKGRSMNSTNNPWISSARPSDELSNDITSQSQDDPPLSKDEAAAVNTVLDLEDQNSCDNEKEELADRKSKDIAD